MHRLLLSAVLVFLLIPTPSRPQAGMIFPAEFEKNEGILLTWDYAPSRDSITANITKAVQHVAKVWIIYYPGQAPYDTTYIRNYLNDHGVQSHNVHFIPGWTETLWIRDYGPFTGYADFGGNTLERYMIDAGYSAYGRPKDDSIPTQLAGLWDMPAVDMPLQFEGGNIILDGLHRGFASKRIYDQNPGLTQQEVKYELQSYFGMNEFVFLDNLNHSGGGIWKHVDMYMKFLDYEKILVSEYPDSLPDYPVIEGNVEVMESLLNSFARNYEIVRIPAPPKDDGTYATTQDDEMRTYTNSLIINGVVVVPSYNLPYYDSIARVTYEKHMPGYEIVMVDARQLTIHGGAIHCITREVAQPEFLRIRHAKVTGQQEYVHDFPITCNTYCNTEVDSLYLHYRINGGDWIATEMFLSCPMNFGIVENVLETDTVDYYIWAKANNTEVKYPFTGPEGYFTFWFDQTTGLSQFEDDRNFQIFPNPTSGPINVVADDCPSILNIFDIYGHQVFQSELGQKVSRIDLSAELKPGIYVCQYENNGKTTSKRLVIN